MRTEHTVALNPAGDATPPTLPVKRMDWPDIAKGLSILGVVILHVTLEIPEARGTFMAELNELLHPIRMPLFFLVSGFFSAKILNQTFEQLFKRRLWFFLVPYLLWTPVELFSYRVLAHFGAGDPYPDLSFYWEQITEGRNTYWFLYFLILFNLVAWATRRFPGWALCLVPFIPWLFMPMFSEESIVRRSVLFLPAFFIGLYFRPLIIRFAKAAERPKTVVIAVAIYVAAMGLDYVEDYLGRREPGPRQLWFIDFKDDIAEFLGGTLTSGDLVHFSGMVIRCMSLPVGIVLAVWLARVKYLGDALKFLGRHTLVVYIGHAFGLWIAFRALKWQFMEIDNASPYFWNWSSWWMLIAFAFAMFGGWVFHLLTKTPLVKWTLVPPRLPERGGRKTARTSDVEVVPTDRAAGDSINTKV